MARNAPLVPTLIKSRKAQGKASWCLSVPSHLSSTGERQRLFYATKTAAALEADKLAVRRDNFGVSLSSMTPARIAEASEAYDLLDVYPGVSLLSAVRAHIATLVAQGASTTFLELFNDYITAKADRNPACVNELRITRDRFPHLHEKLVCDIRPADLESTRQAECRGSEPHTSILARHPKFRRQTRIPRGKSRIQTGLRHPTASGSGHHSGDSSLGNAESRARERSETASLSDVGIFLRDPTNGRTFRIEWSDVKADQVVIRPEVSKTNRRRFVDISSNARAWLNEYAARGGVMTGPIVQFTESELRSHRKANWKAAGVLKWPQTGMRHTYCSNWLATFKDVNKLVLQSGHDNVDTMWRSYHQGIQESEAAKYWALVPPGKPGKIISITAAA